MHHKAALYYEDVQVGDVLPEFTRKTGYIEWGRFAGANEEHVVIHEDDEEARKVGLPGGIGMGNLRLVYVQNMLSDWMGEGGWIKKVALQYRGMNLKNDLVVTKGRVVNKFVQDGEHLVELEVAAENQKGEATAPGQAVVSLPSRSQRA
ncbi:MAG: hypothetical protein HYY02_06825 [Chloroflexi bacterium]|nr:hypothetical protein [Chloroflexota bacterium]